MPPKSGTNDMEDGEEGELPESTTLAKTIVELVIVTALVEADILMVVRLNPGPLPHSYKPLRSRSGNSLRGPFIILQFGIKPYIAG